MDKAVNKANLAIKTTQEPTIAHRKFAAVCILASRDVILLASTVDNIEQLTRKPD